MLKLFAKTFKTTNDCIILVAPLIVLLSIYGWYYNYTDVSVNTLPKFVLAFITRLVMFSGFAAAWLYMAKKTLVLSKKVFVFDKDRTREVIKLITSLPKGIGRLFLPMLGVNLTYIIIYLLLFFVVGNVVHNLAGSVDYNAIDLNDLVLAPKETLEEISKLSSNVITALAYWSGLFLSGYIIISFISMFWIPEIVYGEKNPYKALMLAVKKVFYTFNTSILLFLYIFLLTLILAISIFMLSFSPFLYFFVLMVQYYFLVYIVVLLFTYYEQKFITEEI